MIFRRPSGFYAIDFQDARVGRVAFSARTKRKGEAQSRERAIRQLVDWGEYGIVERVKARLVHLTDVEVAVAESDPIRRESLLDALRGADTEQGRHMLGAAVDRLLQAVEATREGSTLGAYKSHLKDAERFFGVERDEEGAITRDVDMVPLQASDRWRAWLTEPKATAGGGTWALKTQALARATLGRLWREEVARAAEFAELYGGKPILRLNPIKATERPRLRQTRVVFLSPDEWQSLARANKDYPIASLLALGCLAGLRLMEAGNLRTGIDVVLDGDAPRIIVQPRTGEFPWKAKTDRSNREIPIPVGGELHRTLQRHVEVGYAGSRYFIRSDRTDKPYSRRHLGMLTKEAFERAGIKYGRKGDALTAHSLRHTFVSWLVQRDVQALKIARLIGDRPEQVYHTYGHLFPGELAVVMGVVESVAKSKVKSSSAAIPAATIETQASI